METEELDNLNKNELFEMLKDKCKSRAKVSLYIGLIFLIIIVLFMIFALKYRPHYSFHDNIDDILFTIYFIVLGCAAGCLVLFSYLLLKKTDSLDSPHQLLCRLEKKIRYEKVCFLLPMLIWIIQMIYDGFIKEIVSANMNGTDMKYVVMVLAIGIVFCAFYVFIFLKYGKISRKDEEIIEQLQDLVEK